MTTETVDELGIARAGGGLGGWPAVRPGFVRAVLSCSTADDVVEAMTSGPDALSEAEQRRLLEPAGGAAALLAPVRPGSAVLDLGTGWSNLAPTLVSLGATVTVADWSYPRLRFYRLVQPAPARRVQLEPGQPLPFPDASFDVVFAAGDQVRAAGGAGPGGGYATAVAELHRVLRDGGCLVYATGNPLRRPAAARGATRPGPAAGAGGLRSVLAPWQDRELTRAGFCPPRVVAAHPRRSGKHALVPLARLQEYLAGCRPPAPGRAVRRRLRGAAVRANVGRWLVGDYYLVTGRGPLDDRWSQPSLAASLPPFAGEDEPVVRMLSDARAAVVGRDAFVKFPLSTGQQQALASEVRRSEAVRGTALRDVVVASSRVETWQDVPYAVYPRVAHRVQVSAGDALAAMCRVLDTDVGARPAPLPETELWRRLTRPRGQADIAAAGAGRLYRAVVDRCSGATVPVGPTHGDLHADNVLLADSGDVLLVDWNRFEVDNPMFLDPAYAAVRAHVRETGAPLSAAVAALADGALDGPLAARADARRGELDPLSAASLLLLDRVVSYSEPRRRLKPWTVAPIVEAVQALEDRLP